MGSGNTYGAATFCLHVFFFLVVFLLGGYDTGVRKRRVQGTATYGHLKHFTCHPQFTSPESFSLGMSEDCKITNGNVWGDTSAYLPHSLPPLPLQPRDIVSYMRIDPAQDSAKPPRPHRSKSARCVMKSIFSSCDPTRRINSVFVRLSPTLDETPKHPLLGSSSLLPIYLKRHFGSWRRRWVSPPRFFPDVFCPRRQNNRPHPSGVLSSF